MLPGAIPASDSGRPQRFPLLPSALFHPQGSAMAYRNLEIADRGAVRTITVARPDKLNALDRDTLNELTLAFTQAAQEDGVRVVVLAGSGEKAFVAGADIAQMSGYTPLQAQ